MVKDTSASAAKSTAYAGHVKEVSGFHRPRHGAPRITSSDRASIIGLVQDTSGAIMPGVTVDASSDVLMERVRSAATDGAGRFAIVGLRAGTHIVTTSRRTATSGNRVSCVSPEAAYALPTPV